MWEEERVKSVKQTGNGRGWQGWGEWREGAEDWLYKSASMCDGPGGWR